MEMVVFGQKKWCLHCIGQSSSSTAIYHPNNGEPVTIMAEHMLSRMCARLMEYADGFKTQILYEALLVNIW